MAMSLTVELLKEATRLRIDETEAVFVIEATDEINMYVSTITNIEVMVGITTTVVRDILQTFGIVVATIVTRDSDRRSSYSSSRYDNINYGSSRYSPDPTDRSIGRGGKADYARKKFQELPTRKDSHWNSGRPPQRYLNSEFEVNGVIVNLEENSTTSTEEDSPNQRTLIKQRAICFKKRISSASMDTLSAQLRTTLCSRTFGTRCHQRDGYYASDGGTGRRRLGLSGMFAQNWCCSSDCSITTLTPLLAWQFRSYFKRKVHSSISKLLYCSQISRRDR
jgi:hypothetical protein